MESRITAHTGVQSVILHLLPGVLTGACYYLLAPLVAERGFPTVTALSLAGLLVLIPFEAGFLLYRRKSTGVKLFSGLIPYTEPMKVRQYVVSVFLIVILAGAAFKIFSFTSDLLMPLFQWIPSAMVLDMGLEGNYGKRELIISYGLFLLLPVLVLPAVEEVYFRGYLLPRMPSKLGRWREAVHSGLFALYHIWTPWLLISRTAAVLPLVYVVTRKKNIYAAVIAHCLINSIDFFVGLGYIMQLSG